MSAGPKINDAKYRCNPPPLTPWHPWHPWRPMTRQVQKFTPHVHCAVRNSVRAVEKWPNVYCLPSLPMYEIRTVPIGPDRPLLVAPYRDEPHCSAPSFVHCQLYAHLSRFIIKLLNYNYRITRPEPRNRRRHSRKISDAHRWFFHCSAFVVRFVGIT